MEQRTIEVLHRESAKKNAGAQRELAKDNGRTTLWFSNRLSLLSCYIVRQHRTMEVPHRELVKEGNGSARRLLTPQRIKEM